MRKTILPILPIFFVSTATVAEPILVRTGEHENFTRIAIDALPGNRYEVVQTGQEVRVRLPENRDGYDTANFFSRLTNNRVQDVQQTNQDLIINLSCKCGLDSFVRSDGIIVVDVSEDYNTQTAQEKTRAELAQNQLRGIELFLNKNDPSASQEPTLETKTQSASQFSETPFVPKNSNVIENLTTTQNDLALDLASAASRGILRANGPTLPEAQRAQIDVSIFDASRLVQSVEGAETGPNVRVTSSSETETNSRTLEIGKDSCPPPSVGALSTWGGTGNFHFEVTTRRLQLANDRDEIQEKKAESLARSYLYFGFTNEALRLLNTVERSTTNIRILKQISHLIDNEVKEQYDLDRYLDCPNAIALWAFLATITPEKLPDNVTNAILLELGSQPLHLRQMLSKRLSNKFIEIGDSTSASIAARTVDRATKEIQANKERNLVSAVTDLTYLHEIVEQRLQKFESIDNETLEIIGSYLIQFKNTDEYEKLSRTNIIALSLSGMVTKAIDALREHAKFSSSRETAEISNEIIRILIAQGNEEKLIEVVANQEILQENLNSKNGAEVAQILASFGIKDAFDQISQVDSAIEDYQRRANLSETEQSMELSNITNAENESDRTQRVKTDLSASVINGAAKEDRSNDESLELRLLDLEGMILEISEIKSETEQLLSEGIQ